MTRERWGEIKRIVNLCLDIPADQRAEHVATLCSGDALLMDEVTSMLAAHAEVGDFMESAALEPEPEEAPASGSAGNYRLCERIGEGGMGVVYRAVRASDFQKQVAIKIVKRGMDTDFILRRFRQERQILAGLDHPHIARLLDAGATDEGQPYLVMEYIEGRPITEYCEQLALKIAERLQLFRMVCAAVQYAHQNLVVHRDLKPGNILVTSGGFPKLLDFGIAKLLEPHADSTITAMRMMTPECASPEQLRGESITTATDIYSLGVLLYQLLTGEPPYRFTTRSPEEFRRIICETEPRKPSAVRAVSKDLDTIVLKAMHKEASRRYSSAEQLSEDIHRYLIGMPVMARKDTLGYRASKFISRHKSTSVAAGLLALSLVGGLAATLWQARVSAAARQAAEQRFREVRALAGFNIFELNDALEKVPASAAARHLLIQHALEYLDKLRGENSTDRDLMREVAAGYERIGDLQGRFTGNGIGDVQSSVASLRKALEIRSKLVEISHHAPDEVASQIRLLEAYTRIQLLSEKLEGAVQSARTELALSLEMTQDRPQDAQARISYANASSMLAGTLGGSGSGPSTREFDEAIRHDRAAIEILTGVSTSGVAIRQRITLVQLRLAFHYWKSDAFEQGLRILDSVLSEQATRSSMAPLMLVAYNWRGNTFERLGDHRRALQNYRRGLLLASAAAAANPDDLDVRLNRDILTGLVAMEQARLGDARAGIKRLNEAIGSVEQMFAANPEAFYRRILIIGYAIRGDTLSALGDQPAARANFSQSLSIAEELAKNDLIDMESRLQIARAHAALGILWARSARLQEARQELSRSLASTGQFLVQRPADGEALNLAKTDRAALAALDKCTGDGPCGPVARFELPSLIN